MKVVILENHIKKNGDLSDLYDSGYAILTRIYGGHFIDNSKLIQKTLSKGDVLELKEEVDNEYDAFAVAIYYKGRKLGFIKRDFAKKIRNINKYNCIVYSPLLEHSMDIGAQIILKTK